MSTTDTKVDELIINTLTKAQYDSLVANNQIEANQLYLTKDEDYYTQMAVTYGTTTYAQITSALTAKQEPVCNYNSYQYTYAGNDGTYYYFTCAINSEIKYVRVSSSNVWTNGTASLQTTISDINTIRANASLGATAVQPSDLATVATTGSYTDLSNKPTIPTVNNASLVIQKNSSNVATFTANASANVTCNITVPTKVSDLNNDSGFITGITANNVTTALGYTPYNSTNPNGYTTNTGTVKSVRVQAGTGLSSSTSTAQNTTLNTTISIASGYKLPTTTEWSGKQDALPAQSGQSGKFLTTNGSTLSWATVSTGTSDYSSLTNKPSINSVTLSGNKTSSDLGLQPALATQTVYSAKGSATKVPQITTNNLGQVTSITEVTITQPTVNNATLTIQKNGTTVSSFTSNASSNVTCNITVPTKVSDLTNDSGFITGITANNVTTALGYTPYNSSNPSGYTSNTGTVTSVRVQAGTGLSSSTSTAQNTTLNTTISIASGYKLPTTTEWSNKQDKLTAQTAYTSKGSATKVPQITTNTLGQVTGITEVTITQPTVNNSTITIQKNGTNVDSFTTNASSDKSINIEVPTDAGSINGITKLYNGWFQNLIEEGVQYGEGLNKGYFTSFNLLHGVQDNFYLANKGLRNGTPAIISCNYYDPYGYDFVNGEFGRWDTNINPSTAFSTTPFVWEIKCPTSFEWTDVCRLFIVGHRIYSPFYVTKYKIEVAYAYSNSTYSWGTVVDYNGTSVDITRKYYDLVTSASGASYHQIYGIRLTISESSETVFSLAEFMLLCARGSEKKSESMNSLDLGGGKVVGNITIPTEYGSFVGNLNGNASSADGVIDRRTYNNILTWTGTRAQYDAIETKNPNTLYNITDDTDTTAAMLELLYPVGAVYIGTMDVCPLASLGIGSWEKIAEDQVLQGSSSNHNAGATIAAGLPNITGEYWDVAGRDSGENGAIKYVNGEEKAGLGSGSAIGYGMIYFDASKANSIYGNSNTVQPPAFVVNIWRRIS